MIKIILVGPAASGKDYIRKKLVNKSKEFCYSIKYTTRPIRDDEEDGKDYFFISEKEFKELLQTRFFIEYSVYRDRYYGTAKIAWETCNLFIMTPDGLSQLQERVDLSNTLILYFNTEYGIRSQRLIERNDTDSAIRRLEADYLDFKDFNIFDIQIKNSDF
jgi:guanylate kinase